MTNNHRRNLARGAKRLPNTTFHVTGHAIDDLRAFGSHVEKRTFINCLERHLSPKPIIDAKRRPYKKVSDCGRLLAFCVMDNHFHLVVHQFDGGGMHALMHTVLSGYAKWFNNQRGRTGPVLRERYAASPLFDHAYAKRAIAYVHLNHVGQQLDHPYSSHDYFIDRRRCDWLDVDKGLAVFGGPTGYTRYLGRFGPEIVAAKLAKREQHLLGASVTI